MGIIRQMDEALATRIAAGEVVERPASVVKELIENAIDACATTIDVALEDGGLRLIRVADDGIGMDEEDAKLCLWRHASSKVKSVADLDLISTLGFRGEALAAIFAVSHLRIETRQAESGFGTCVRGSAGTVHEVSEIARRPGTTIEVGALFHNTPARRRFVATPRAETGRVIRVLTDAAIARPKVTITLTVDGEERLRYSATHSLLERIRQVHGDQFADSLIEIAGVRGDVRVHGYMTRPADSVRSSRRSAFALNGRPVDDHVLRGVVSRTLGAAIPHGTRPEVIVHASVPVGAVDVNVSPDKSRVRYRQGLENQLWAAVSDAVRGVLADARSVAVLGDDAPAPEADIRMDLPNEGTPQHSTPRSNSADDGLIDLFADAFEATGENTPQEDREYAPARRHGIPEEPAMIQQVAGTFLMTAVEGGILLVDQHSAHERVLYERLKASYAERRGAEAIDLLIPHTIRVSAEERALLDEMAPYLARLGMEIDSAGPNEVWLRSMPAALGRKEPERVLRALMDEFRTAQDRGASADDLDGEISAFEDRLLMTAACKAAVKSGQILSKAEIRALWRDLIAVDLACHDVHGRPGVVLVPATEIMRRFGRSSLSS